MAKYLSVQNQPARRFRFLVTMLALFAAASLCRAADTLTDPTRPPEGFGHQAESKAQETAVEPVLQSVLISPRRKSAIISGKLVSLGGEFGELHVTSIQENQVVLMRGTDPASRLVLTLYPAVGKEAIRRSRADPTGALP